MASSCSMSFKTVISLSIERGSESKRGLLLAGSLAVIAANAWVCGREGGRSRTQIQHMICILIMTKIIIIII